MTKVPHSSNKPSRTILKETVKVELQSLIAQSVKFQNLINTSKTNVKQNLYKKKLKKNNEKIYDLLLALDKIETLKDNNKTLEFNSE